MPNHSIVAGVGKLIAFNAEDTLADGLLAAGGMSVGIVVFLSHVKQGGITRLPGKGMKFGSKS